VKGDLLLIENDRRLGELLCLFLERRGHTARRAASFAEARVLIEERTPDLLLSDLQLGEEDAREELPRLSAEGCLPPTLVVSGFLDTQTVDELARIPQVCGTLPKPFEFDELMTCIDELLARGAEA
jgi:DNA-binding response OmpR family regulator